VGGTGQGHFRSPQEARLDCAALQPHFSICSCYPYAMCTRQNSSIESHVGESVVARIPQGAGTSVLAAQDPCMFRAARRLCTGIPDWPETGFVWNLSNFSRLYRRKKVVSVTITIQSPILFEKLLRYAQGQPAFTNQMVS
jgi:hypothetical protein